MQITRRIEALNKDIETAVYMLYGLSDKHARVVEGALPDRARD